MMSPEEVLDTIVYWMYVDNLVRFELNDGHMNQARPHITRLIEHGFFQDDKNDMESSFARAAMGEETEMREYFSSCAEAYEGLDEVLNDIFDNGGPFIHPIYGAIE